MNISAKTEYACIAVLELAAHFRGDQPLRIRSIAERHGIPARFLVQILLQLKGAGLVKSTRGAAGGYRLAKEPRTITLADVMRIIEGHPGELSSNAAHATAVSATLLDAWQEVARVEQRMLSAITFADLVERTRDQSENMYYI